MPSFVVALAGAEDISDILALQQHNHISTLPESALANGFVTTQLSRDTIRRMREWSGIWSVRAEQGELAAYACANPWEFYGEGEFQSAAKALLPRRLEQGMVTGDNTFQYGPVCVAHAFRGQGVLPLLVDTIKAHYAPRLEFGLTFIDSRNTRSLAAHERKLGFVRLAPLLWGTVTYHMLAFATQKHSSTARNSPP